MQIKIIKPSTVYIKFLSYNPKKFVLYASTASTDENNIYYFRYLGYAPRIKFNIPDVGEYYSDTDFEVVKIVPIETPKTYPVLPPAERNRGNSFTYRINKDINGQTPARIYTDTGLIEVSEDFFQLPIPVRIFLLLHEQAHIFYSTEQFCDEMAMINFLRLGYNASNAYYALTDTLSRSPLSVDRMKYLFNSIQKTQTNNLTDGLT